jgi:hypothetical protein
MSTERYTVQELHAETARIQWQELEVHFARGVVIRVASELDLVKVAVDIANDHKPAVEGWITAGQVEHLDMETARDWSERDPELWAVVVAPWVVVQERVS